MRLRVPITSQSCIRETAARLDHLMMRTALLHVHTVGAIGIEHQRGCDRALEINAIRSNVLVSLRGAYAATRTGFEGGGLHTTRERQQS